MLRILFVLALILALEPVHAQAKRGPNVIVITADTLRGDMIGPNGNREVRTPNLDALAAEGVTYTRAYTTLTTTLPAHASLFSSLYPRDHKAYGNVGGISSAITTVFEVVKQAGWHTAAHINMPWLKLDVSNIPQGVKEAFGGDSVKKAERTNPWVLSFLDRQKDATAPFFLWVHYTDNHTPYHAPGDLSKTYFTGGKTGAGTVALGDIWKYFPPDHKENEQFVSWLTGVKSADYVIGTYKGSVTWLDQHLGQVFDRLKANDQWDDTIIVFVSDHGEALGEHNLWFVHAGLYEGTGRVPLIVRVPGGPRNKKVDTVVSLVDVMPTILARLGLGTPAEARGRDLWPLIDAGLAGSTVIEHTGKQQEAVVTQRYKLVTHLRTTRYYSGYPMNAGFKELYDLQADPKETKNIAAANPTVVAELEALGLRLQAGERPFTGTKVEVDDEMRKQLEALGYFEE